MKMFVSVGNSKDRKKNNTVFNDSAKQSQKYLIRIKSNVVFFSF